MIDWCHCSLTRRDRPFYLCYCVSHCRYRFACLFLHGSYTDSAMLARLDLMALALIALVALPGAGSGAMAGQATVGGVSINLPPPEGFCELTDRNPADKGMITKIGEVVGKGDNRLLNMSADCGQLADWRAQRRLLDDFAEYQ